MTTAPLPGTPESDALLRDVAVEVLGWTRHENAHWKWGVYPSGQPHNLNDILTSWPQLVLPAMQARGWRIHIVEFFHDPAQPSTLHWSVEIYDAGTPIASGWSTDTTPTGLALCICAAALAAVRSEAG